MSNCVKEFSSGQIRRETIQGRNTVEVDVIKSVKVMMKFMLIGNHQQVICDRKKVIFSAVHINKKKSK